MEVSLAALFVSAFVSATILPGSSELALAAVLKGGGTTPVVAVVVAAIGNTLGGLTTYALGRLLPSRIPDGAALARVRRFGPFSLLFSWLPVVGDALCAAAGWLRLPVIACIAAMAAGKLARYALLAQAMAFL